MSLSPDLPNPDAPIAPREGSGAMFDAIAGRYDLMNRILSFGVDRGWRRAAVLAMAIEPGARVVDVATGTGDMALTILERHPGARVVGVDPSVEMLRVAQQKVDRATHHERVELHVGEAERLPLPDASVDAACIAFGIRNVVDRPRALRELARVTRKGGRVVVLELSEPQRGVLSGLARIHIHHVVPRVGSFFAGQKEYAYLQRSIAAFPQPQDFAEIMRAAGLDVLHVRPLTFGVSCLFVATPTEGYA